MYWVKVIGWPLVCGRGSKNVLYIFKYIVLDISKSFEEQDTHSEPSWNSATYWKSTELIEKKTVLIYTTRWQYTAIDDNDGGFSGSTSSKKACTFFHLEKQWGGGGVCVRACIFVWMSERVRVGKQNVFCWDAPCTDTNALSSWLFDWIEVSKNQLRHTQKQICAVRMMQRILCWLSQGLVHHLKIMSKVLKANVQPESMCSTDF